jgi:hypothetical protein
MAIDFLQNLKIRNELLYYFGWVCLICSIVFLILTRMSDIQVAGVNAWYKPFKFAFSTVLYSWAIAWFVFYLPGFNVRIFSWAVIILLGFEIVYIAIQAARGQLSHFNLSSGFYSFMYAMMALAATAVTLYTAYIAVLFFSQKFPELPQYYLWAIRLGLILFVIFSFEGFVMGSKLTHTIGGKDGGPGLPLVNWSYLYGDPRIAHFIGMHALQVLPLLSYFILKNTKITIAVSILYGALAAFTLVQALSARPLIKGKNIGQYENRDA